MSYGVFRYREAYYRLPRPRIHTGRAKPRYYLPDASIRDQWGRRKWFIFDDHDGVGFIVEATNSNHIALEMTLSINNGTIETVGSGKNLLVAAVTDTRWKCMFTNTSDFSIDTA